MIFDSDGPASRAVPLILPTVEFDPHAHVETSKRIDMAFSVAAARAVLSKIAFHEHSEKPDGIIYPSRLNGHTNLAVFDRAIGKLRSVQAVKLIAAPDLAAVLNDLQIGII